MSRTISVLIVAAVLLLAPLAGSAQPSPEATPEPVQLGSLQVIGSYVLPGNLTIDDVVVGGLSGIDYDPATGTWMAVTDDRSEFGPARAYTLNLEYSGEGFDEVTVEGVATLLQANGQPYPSMATGGSYPDFETIRLDPTSGLLWYAHEGGARRSISPYIVASTRDGEFVASPALPEMFEADPSLLIGPRDNYGLESMSFSLDGTTIWFGMETPLYQDGPVPTSDHGAPVRLTNIDRAGAMLNQVVYELDPIPVQTFEGRFFDTGLTEILALDDTRFLAVERATVEDDAGVYTNYIKVYEIDIVGATNVAARHWLVPGSYTPVTKRLVLDLNAEGVDPIDNIEGISWGPVLENGNRSLVLVADSNFNESQEMVFHAIEVVAEQVL